jgi:methyltransferase (TIGR00027 family)
LVNRPSATAVLVARGVVAIYSTPRLRAIVPPALGELTAKMLCRESAGSRFFVRMLRYRWFRAFAFRIERAVTPGIFLHFALRKRFIEDAVRGSIQNGAQQVIVLGAGLDTLSARLSPEFPKVSFLEVDHPASQAAKLHLLPSEAKEPKNLHFCALDFAQADIASGLRACDGFLQDVKTVFIAEGLLMYLPVEAVQSLFETMRAVAPDCDIAFSAIDIGVEGRPELRRSMRIVQWWLARISEPFRWGIHRDEVGPFLNQFGLTLVDRAGADELRTRYLPPELGRLEPARGEYLYFASAVP